MSGRRRQGLAPTLFPFLAVLVCTLGTLILLLALVAQNAGEAVAATDAVRDAESESQATPSEEDLAEAAALAEAATQIEREIREATWHREQSVKLRDEQTAELEARRDRIAHLEDHVRRLRMELQSLSTEVEAAIDRKGDVVQAQETLDKLLLEIETEKNAIGNLQSDLQSETPRVVIVPHKGPNGTDRRPVYIECGAGGVVIQPGNIRISLSELEPRVGFPNPLEAALRTIRLHAAQTYGDTLAPYPLLVVRPDGITSYGVARAAMSNWDDQFGYELVPAEVDLAFPETDPTLSTKVANIIRDTVRQRELLAMRFGGSGGGGGGNGSGRDGGRSQSGRFEGDFDDGMNPSPGGFSGGTAGGTELAAGGAAGGSASLPGDAPNASPSASTLPVLSASAMSRGSTNGAIGDSRLRGFTANNDSARSPANANTGGNGGYTGPIVKQNDGGAIVDNVVGGGMTGPGDRYAGTTGPRTEAFSAGADSLDGSALGGDSVNSGAGGTSEYNGPSKSAGASKHSKAAGSATGGNGGAQASGQFAQNAESQQGQSAASGNSDNPPDGGAAAPSVNFTNTVTPPVRRVGKDWALPPDVSSSRGTEMLRIIRVECHSDRFVLIGEGGRGAPTVVPFADGNINEATLTLATAVRDRVSHWGAAMQGARWQPVLEVTIAPGAEFRYQQLTQLLDGSGLMVQPKGTR